MTDQRGEQAMDQREALARAVINAEAAERLLAVDDAAPGPYGGYEEEQTARHQGAVAYAAVAQAWATIAPQLPSGQEERAQAAKTRRWESSERRSQS